MAKKSIESLYDVLFNMRKLMEDLVQNATGLVNDVNDYGGELNRVVKEQMQKYYIPAIQNLTKDENTPGSIIGIIRFMDSLPLAMTRVEPQVEQVAPVEQPNANIDMPVQSSAAPEEAIPLNTSYENPMPGATPEAPATPVEQPMAESKMKESITKYSILRKSNKESSLGEDIANLEDKEVCLFDTEEEAQARCDLLNKGVLPEEKDLFGTEYVVEKKEICPEC